MEKRVLVVDDDAVIRDTVSSTLVVYGFGTHTCSDGDEAVEYYRDNHRQVDYVLMDVKMPRMDGVTAYRRMKEINPNIVAAIFSGAADEDVIQELVRTERVFFLRKPFRCDQLLAWLGKSKDD